MQRDIDNIMRFEQQRDERFFRASRARARRRANVANAMQRVYAIATIAFAMTTIVCAFVN